jgi:DNA-binding transcriptional LysR family regulator
MDYNRVALFVRVVESGSFTAAAAATALPKSTVSRSISHLESDLGVRLLQRTTRKLALTDAGQAFYDAVRPPVAAIDEADAATRERGSDPRGVVRLTAPPDFMRLAPLVVELSKKHPGLRVELTLTSRAVDLVSEGFDLAVRAGRLEDSTLVARRVGAAQQALFAAPAYLRRRGRPRTIADLATHDWVLYRAAGGRANLHLDGPDNAVETVEVSGALVADNMGFCAAAVEAGAGLALLPVLSVVDGLDAGNLEPVLPGWTSGSGAAVYVVLPTARHVPARVAVVRDFLVERLTKELERSYARCAKKGNGAPATSPAPAAASRSRSRPSP